MAGIRLPLRNETGQPLPYFRLVRRSRQSGGCRMVLSDERATPEEGIGRRRIYDFWTMASPTITGDACARELNVLFVPGRSASSSLSLQIPVGVDPDDQHSPRQLVGIDHWDSRDLSPRAGERRHLDVNSRLARETDVHGHRVRRAVAAARVDDSTAEDLACARGVDPHFRAGSSV